MNLNQVMYLYQFEYFNLFSIRLDGYGNLLLLIEGFFRRCYQVVIDCYCFINASFFLGILLNVEIL